MNPEDSSTEPLSDVFMDRFDVVRLDYPEELAMEEDIVLGRGQQLVSFPKGLLRAMLEFVRALRQHRDLEKKPSVRASIGLYERAQAHAYLARRSEVSLQDVERAVISVLSHRIKLKPNKQFVQTPEEFVRQEFLRFSERRNEQMGGRL